MELQGNEKQTSLLNMLKLTTATSHSKHTKKSMDTNMVSPNIKLYSALFSIDMIMYW
jgi:hypothetical protein